MGRTVVITGGTSGIGLELKNLFEKNGDTVLTFSLDESSDQNHYVGSVSHDIKVRQIFNDIHERFGTIDILINCAGLGMSAITELAPMEDINNIMDVNFYGTLYCIRAAVPYMTSGAKIVNMSSAMALFPVPFRSIYGASKAAVHNLSMSLSMELKALGIEVISMCPGDTKTNFTKNRIKDFSTTERYGDMLETATLASDAKEDKRMTVEYVAEKIFKLVNKKKCKPFYIIGGKYKFLYFLTRLTPKSLLLNCTAKKKGGVFKKAEPKVKKVKEKPTTEVVAEEVQNVEDIVEANEVEQVEVVEENKETETKPSLNNILSKITVLNKSEAKSEEENSEGVVEKTEPEVVEASKSEDVEVNAENSGESEVVAEVKEEESKEKETDEANEEKKKDQ